MKYLKNTVNLENYIVNDLKSDEDIKLFLNASLKDYLKDGDFNSFYRALEIVIRAKDTISSFYIIFKKYNKRCSFFACKNPENMYRYKNYLLQTSN